MEKYITKEEAQSLEFTLRNSRDQELTLSLWDIIKKEKECDGCTYFPTELAEMQDPKEGDWLESIEVPVFNGRYNPEIGESEFCDPYWDTQDGKYYSTDLYRVRMFWHDGVWHYPSSYRPKNMRNTDCEDFRSPLFE